MKRALILFVFAASLANAGDRASRWVYRISAISFAATNGADMGTSMALQGRPGMHETGWMYGGSFSGRAIGFKLAIVGGQFLVERLILRHHPSMQPLFTLSNFAQTLGPAIAVRHNLGLLEAK